MSITLTAKQLREALYWANPNKPGESDFEESEDTEVTIDWMPARESTEGEPMAAGLYLYLSEYPEEGVIGPLGTPGAPTEAMFPGKCPNCGRGDNRPQSANPLNFNLVADLYVQRAWSMLTFGPGERSTGVLDHIRKELTEIEAAPRDLEEWVDLVLLALDGAWRAGHSPEEIALAIADKQARNERREWPDWRDCDPGKAIEHVKS